jgi:hypothetical protein
MQIHVRTARRLLERLAADGYVEQTYDTRHQADASGRVARRGGEPERRVDLVYAFEQHFGG